MLLKGKIIINTNLSEIRMVGKEGRGVKLLRWKLDGGFQATQFNIMDLLTDNASLSRIRHREPRKSDVLQCLT